MGVVGLGRGMRWEGRQGRESRTMRMAGEDDEAGAGGRWGLSIGKARDKLLNIIDG